jgi:hypothetical protein
VRPVKLEPPVTAVVKSPILARPVFAVSALITLGVLSMLFLMAVVEGITPWGAELPVSIARVLDAADWGSVCCRDFVWHVINPVNYFCIRLGGTFYCYFL